MFSLAIRTVVLTSLVSAAQLAVALPAQVTVSGRQLVVQKRLPDNSLGAAAPYAIRGVVWSPASDTTNTSPSDPNNVAVRRGEYAIWADTDVPLLAAMHVNTVYMIVDPGTDAAGTAILDRLHDAGIMVIMTVDNGVNDLARVDQVVAFYKDHPAVLGWVLGNEWNINRYRQNISVAEAATRTETAAQHIKAIDTGHPVISSYGEIDINATGMHLSDTQHYVNDVCLHVDVWGVNVYRGNSFLTLFAQWASISTKPMLVGELGTDAFRSAGNYDVGSVDGQMQVDWDLALWDELFVNLSANTPEAVAAGGFVFASNDEWWKVSPAGSQEKGGYTGAHPDGWSNEEYYGIVDIHRNPRPLYAALTTAFDALYEAPRTHAYRAVSLGGSAAEYSFQYGSTWIFLDGQKLYRQNGGGGGGRGFNVAVFDPATGALQQPVQNFDTWGSSDAFCTMSTFLDAVPDGMLILMGVADEAGLTTDPCGPLSGACRTGAIQRLQALGSQQITSYCYRNSWAMAAVKGEGMARDEALGVAVQVSARTTMPVPTRMLALTLSGTGAVHSVPAGLQCDVSCNRTFPLNQQVTLHALPAPNSFFDHWAGACSGTATCSVTLTADVAATATFIPARTLAVTVTDGGTVTSTPAAIQCPVTCSSLWRDGDPASLAASATAGWTFAGWSGDCGGTATPCALTMSADRAANATFVSLPLPPPGGLDARFSGSTATITWNAVPGATAYDVARSDDGQTWNTIASPPPPSATDATVVAGHAYLYRVRAKSSDGTPSSWNSPDLMTAVAFTDDPLLAGATKIKGSHLIQLRTAVNAVRTLAALTSSSFTDPSPAGVKVRAIHVTELRTALNPARAALGLPAVSYARPLLQAGTSVVGGGDIEELRSGVR